MSEENGWSAGVDPSRAEWKHDEASASVDAIRRALETFKATPGCDTPVHKAVLESAFQALHRLDREMGSLILMEARHEWLEPLEADRSFMLDAFEAMLGPKALEVVKLWEGKRVTRYSVDWRAAGEKLDGEQRAEWIRVMETDPGYPIDDIDAEIHTILDVTSREVRRLGEDRDRDVCLRPPYGLVCTLPFAHNGPCDPTPVIPELPERS